MAIKPFDNRKVPGFATVAVLGFLALYLPMMVLVVFSFNDGNMIGRWEGFSFRWYANAFANEEIQAAAFLSLRVALIAATIATICATMAALATTRTTSFGPARWIYLVINQPLIMPEIVMAVALLILFAMIRGLTDYNGAGYLVAAHSAFCIPLAYMPIRARLEGMDSHLESAASDLYASPLRIFRKVTLPLLLPGVLAGFMLAFVISLDDVVISNFVKTAGQETLPTYMLGQIRRGISADVYAISTLLLAASVAIVGGFFLITSKKKT